MVDVDDLDIFLQSVNRDGDQFRDVGGGDDRVSHAGLHERRHSSSLFSSDTVMPEAGVAWYVEGGVGPQPGFLDAEDGRRVALLSNAARTLRLYAFH